MAQYKTGTVSVTNGSAVVTGAGTAWLQNVSPGDSFTIVGSAVTYDIAGVDTDGQLQLTVPYAGATAADQPYAIFRDFTPNGIPEMSQGDIETATIFTRAMRKIDDMVKTVPILTDEARQAAEAAVSAADSVQAMVDEAASSATAAKTSETNAASSASAASSSEAAAASYATTASNAAATATTQAGIATTKAGEAANSATAANQHKLDAQAAAASIPAKATVESAKTGTSDNEYTTPLTVHEAFKQYGLGTHAVTIHGANSLRMSGFFKTGSSWEGSVFPGVHGSNQGVLLHHSYGPNYGVQYFHPMQNHRYYARFLDNGVWSEWGMIYSAHSILGTVSQSNGIPTGAIIERGSNANGEYIRWADGTQICQRRVLFSGSGAGERFVEYTWPAAFASTSYGVFLHPREYGYLVTAINPAAKQGERLNTTNISNSSSITVSTGDSFEIIATAIGRWYY